ncbi:apolipoprotein N-acyltransferase [Austwickia chelonae]|uniref:Apolipoprotein N-acyltransferase n=1 Tax=Austwickia chelonae NBRC 105200 TaxID=1184607 RepID=K6W5R7_9MICO|nr:apolipoprotein N-acyltransferase [Austwickia chelonae]GAB77167.1 apolipoprotein N-acyltransferase [Austwickia chelonae NBRC 105200]SEW04304.1 apolipoprotein N-acyltransferase [Austwickia chelonae]
MLARSLLAVIGGLLLWCAQPSVDLWYLAPFGIALIALSTRGTGPGKGAFVGFLGGMAFMIPLLSWAGVYVGPGPWMALSLLEGLYFLVLGACAGVVAWRDRSYPWLVGGSWVLMELLRSTTPFGGFPWARVAFGQADAPFARVASLAGAPGVTFVVAVCGGFLAVGTAHLLRRCRQPVMDRIPARLRPPSAVMSEEVPEVPGPFFREVGVPGVAALALALAPLAIPLPVDGPTARVMAIQGNVPQAGLDFNAQRRAVLDNHATLTERAALKIRAKGERTPDVVLWPENSSDIDPLRHEDAATRIRSAVDAIDAPVVVGAVLTEPADKLTNAALVYLPGQERPSQRYDKRHPVPFGEYIPYRSFFRALSDKVDLVRRDFVGGNEVGVFRLPRQGGDPGVAVGANICFEVAYDGLVRDGVRDGANLIMVPTNNATFGYTDESVQQLAISRLRAIEHGRSVAHISNVGVSSLITPDGVTHGWTGLFEEAVLTEDLPLRHQRTIATELGDLPAYGTSVLTILAVIVALARRRRRMA